MIKTSNKLKVINAVEQNLGLTVTDIRRIKARDDSKFYVTTEEGLMLCEVVGRKIHYHFAVIAGKGIVKIPKKADLQKPKEVKLTVEGKTYPIVDLIARPPLWLDVKDEEVTKAWRHAVYTATAGGSKEANYAVVVTIYNLKTKTNERVDDKFA